VSSDVFSKTLNVSSNRANDSTRMYWLDTVAGMHACDDFLFFLRAFRQVNIPVPFSSPAIRGRAFVWFEDTLSLFEKTSRLTRASA
jgi:hypothetical protein